MNGEILIHAGKGIDKEAMRRYEHLSLDYPSGCIIAKAIIKDVVPVDESLKKKLKEENELVYYGVVHNSEWDGYGFQLENIEKIKPIPINGKLSFWNYEGKIELLKS